MRAYARQYRAQTPASKFAEIGFAMLVASGWLRRSTGLILFQMKQALKYVSGVVRTWPEKGVFSSPPVRVNTPD